MGQLGGPKEFDDRDCHKELGRPLRQLKGAPKGLDGAPRKLGGPLRWPGRALMVRPGRGEGLVAGRAWSRGEQEGKRG